jgi:hypothetical protein
LEVLVISCHQPEEAQWPMSHDDQLSSSSTVMASAAAAVDKYWYCDQEALWSAVTNQLAASAGACFEDFASCGTDLKQGTFIAYLALTQCAVFLPTRYGAQPGPDSMRPDGGSSQLRALIALRKAAVEHRLAPVNQSSDVWEALAELAQQFRLFDELVCLCDCIGNRLESADACELNASYLERIREYSLSYREPFTTALFEQCVREERRVALLRLPDAIPELSEPLLRFLQSDQKNADAPPASSSLLWLHGIRSGRFEVVEGSLEQLAACGTNSDILRAFRNLASAAMR